MEGIGQYFKRYSGRVFLLGNGPSLSDNDLSKLDPNECITMNRSWAEVDQPLFHCVSGDLRRELGRPQRVLFLGQPEQYKNFSPPWPVVLVQTRIMGVHINPPKKPLVTEAAFNLELGWPPTHCGLFALYAAWWLGFNECYLLGYDGYGTHYSIKDYGDNHFPKHEKLIPEFVSHVKALQDFDPGFKVFNCNSLNAYNNLPVVSLTSVLEC